MTMYQNETYEFQGDELESYEVEIRAMLYDALKNKTMAAFSELQTLREKSQHQHDTITKLRGEVFKMQQVRENELLENTKQAETNIRRQFAAGFNVGDEIYVIGSQTTRTQCEKCTGSGKVMVDVLGKDVKVNCPHCSYGVIIAHYYFPQRRPIHHININSNIWRNHKDGKQNVGRIDTQITLYLSESGDGIEVHKNNSQVFHTLEECRMECDMRNNEVR